jgi:hypothetical protein
MQPIFNRIVHLIERPTVTRQESLDHGLSASVCFF